MSSTYSLNLLREQYGMRSVELKLKTYETGPMDFGVCFINSEQARDKSCDQTNSKSILVTIMS